MLLSFWNLKYFLSYQLWLENLKMVETEPFDIVLILILLSISFVNANCSVRQHGLMLTHQGDFNIVPEVDWRYCFLYRHQCVFLARGLFILSTEEIHVFINCPCIKEFEKKKKNFLEKSWLITLLCNQMTHLTLRSQSNLAGQTFI